MIRMIITAMLAACFLCPITQAQTTQPDSTVPATVGQLELRVNVAMSQRDFAAALPLLEKISQEVANQPDELGPVMEQIRVCHRQIAAGVPATQPTIIPPTEARKPHPAPISGQTVQMEIKQLGNFTYDAAQGGNIPQDVQRLDGCRFQTRGFMISLDQTDNVSQFALVPTLGICCSGAPPQIQHTIVVHIPDGKTVAFDPDEMIVEGILHVHEEKDGGFIVSIFQMQATSVRPAQ